MNAIAIFAKSPAEVSQPLRLAKFIGYEAAAKIYTAILEDNINILKKAAVLQKCDIFIAYARPDEKKELARFNLPLMLLRGQDYGSMIEETCSALFNNYQKIILCVGDMINNSPERIAQYFSLMDRENAAVLAPSLDGSFTLIGLQKKYDIFLPMDWSSPHAYKIMLQRMEDAGLIVFNDGTLSDLDSIEELKKSKRNVAIEHYPKTHVALLKQKFAS